jgi:hypothetical protein
MSASKSRSPIWKITTLVVIFQMLVAQAMAASGAFHQQCHEHADDPGHECVVTLMVQGGYDRVMPDILPVDVMPEVPEAPVPELPASVVTPSHLLGGVLAHAPPRGP